MAGISGRGSMGYEENPLGCNKDRKCSMRSNPNHGIPPDVRTPTFKCGKRLLSQNTFICLIFFFMWTFAMACFETLSAIGLAIASPEQDNCTNNAGCDAEVLVQLGHSDVVESVTLSPSGEYIVSAGRDRVLKLWHATTGREMRTFRGHLEGVLSVTVSPDGQTIASASGDKTIRLWQLSSGKEMALLNGHSNRVLSVAFSPNGKLVASGSDDKTIILWDVKSGQRVRMLQGNREPVYSVQFSPDGKLLVSGSYDNAIRIWDHATAKEVRSFKAHSSSLGKVCFSPCGKYVISNHRNMIKLWQISTGQEIMTYKGHEEGVNSVTFSLDGKYILSGSSDRTLKLWDVHTGREIKTFKGHGDRVTSVSMSPDGKYAVSASVDKTMRVWEVSTGKVIYDIHGNHSSLGKVMFGPKGFTAATVVGHTIRLWDLGMAQPVKTFGGHLKPVVAIAFSSDGKYLVSGGSENNIKLWEVETAKELKKINKPHLNQPGSLIFNHDGRQFISSSGFFDNDIKFWDFLTGKAVRTITIRPPVKEPTTYDIMKSGVDDISLSSDGRYLVAGCRDGALRLYNLATGKKVIHTGSEIICSVAFSPNGRYVLLADTKPNLKLWEVSTGKERVFTEPPAISWSIAFSPDGKHALSGSTDNIVRLWDVSTGRILKTLSGHSNAVRSVGFSPNGKYVLSGSADNTARLWDISTGKEIIKFMSFIDNNWIVITPEGYYNSSLNGHKYLNIRMGNKVYGIDQFYDVFYRPDIVTAKLRGDDISSLITLTIDDAIKAPPPSVEFTTVPDKTNQAKAKVCYKVKSAGGGIGEVRLFHNGKLIESDGYYKDVARTQSGKTQLASLDSKAIYKDLRSVKVKGTTDASPIGSKAKADVVEECKEVEAVPGENEISIAAFNGNNTVQSYMKTASFNTDLPKQDPHLYILSVGIDQYKDQSVSLNYAVKDAKDIHGKLLSQSATLYKPGNIHHEGLFNNQATKANILSKVDALSKVIKPSDGFILFVAGHGVLMQNQYYVLTSDFDGSLLNTNVISSNEIVEMSKKIKSLSQLFIFDTCHAGGVDTIVSGLYDARMSVLAKKMGLHIYASANSLQEAMDGYKGNGLFTHVLLDGLNNNGKADTNKDKNISLVELGAYSKQTTTDLSKQVGHSQTPLIINFGKDNPVYKLR